MEAHLELLSDLGFGTPRRKKTTAVTGEIIGTINATSKIKQSNK